MSVAILLLWCTAPPAPREAAFSRFNRLSTASLGPALGSAR